MIERIQKGENNTTEFKSTLRYNIKTEVSDPEMELSVLKTIAAFLNTNGGVLFIGVDDEKNILGLDFDFTTFKKTDKEDAFQQHFDQLIEKSFDNTFHLFIKLDFETVAGKQLCVIQVKRANRPVILLFDKQTYFFIRRQVTTVKLDLQKTADYIFEKWTNQPASLEMSDMFESESTFKKQLKLQFEISDSLLHEEIKYNWNSYSLIETSILLKSIMVDHLAKSMDFGMLPLIADFTAKHLKYDQNIKYTYNQEHVYTHLNEDEGYYLPAYYPICFIGILYSTAITNKVDIDRLSQLRTMRTIFSSMVECMIDNMPVNLSNSSKGNSSNYHWLIGEMLDRSDSWLSEFNENENFDAASSYIESIPTIIGNCFDELYKGEVNGKLSQEFIKKQMYYHCLSTYFSFVTNNIIRGSIEEVILKNIPKKLTVPIFEFALDEKFALSLNDLIAENFRTSNHHEKIILNHFRNFLVQNQLL